MRCAQPALFGPYILLRVHHGPRPSGPGTLRGKNSIPGVGLRLFSRKVIVRPGFLYADYVDVFSRSRFERNRVVCCSPVYIRLHDLD